MARQAASQEDRRTRLAERSGWQTATRDDAAVAEGLQQTRAMDQISPLNEAACFDERFHALREIGAWQLLEALDPDERAGALDPFIQCVLCTSMRGGGGVQRLLAPREVRLTDAARMGGLGFNAAQVPPGSHARGVSRRTQPGEIREAGACETVADPRVQIGPARLAALFNGAIRCRARQGMLPKQIDAGLDATDDEATPRDQTDDGRAVPKVSRAKRPGGRANPHAQKSQVAVCGWKLGLLFEPVSKSPWALAIDGITGSDTAHACAVLAQARANVAGDATIRAVARDRGVLDGKRRSRIDRAAVGSIPAKAHRPITADAREIARRAEGLATHGQRRDGGTDQARVARGTPGAGPPATVAERRTPGGRMRDRPRDGWTPEGSTAAAHAKGCEPQRVNAPGGLRGDGAPQAAETEVVLLDPDPAPDPCGGFDAYAERRRIENPGHREAKASGLREPHPQRSAAGVRVQADCVCRGLAGVTAFRLDRQQSAAAERRGAETGISRFRRPLTGATRDQGIVCCGAHVGIFRPGEVVMRLGGRVRDRALLGEAAQTVLARCRPRPRDPA